jgi:aspartyl protease family protein
MLRLTFDEQKKHAPINSFYNCIMSAKRFGFLMYLAAFALLLGMLTWLFSQYSTHKNNTFYEPRSLEIKNGDIGVRLIKSRSGHYIANGKINDQVVKLMVDTGATDVVVSEKIAKKAGIRKRRQVTIVTANGETKGWSANITSLQLGQIEERDVRAVIVPSLGDMHALLGMSFLERLTFAQTGNELIIKK